MKFRKFIKESLKDMDKRCPKCDNLLNDMGTCPYCDHGEEDAPELEEAVSCDYHVEQFAESWYGVADCKGKFCKENNKPVFFKTADEATTYIESLTKKTTVTEAMSNREKLKAAYPELNFDSPMTEEVVEEELSNKEKLLRAYPELNFDKPVMEESLTETMSIRDRLKAAYPELNFDKTVEESIDPKDDDPKDDDPEDDEIEFDNVFEDNFEEYDDEYDIDDADADYAHAALYGGDLTYCKHCGTRLERNEWGGYCPECDKDDIE